MRSSLNASCPVLRSLVLGIHAWCEKLAAARFDQQIERDAKVVSTIGWPKEQ
jgi:hypothetical protein